MTTLAPPPPRSKPRPSPVAASPAPVAAARPARTFAVADWSGDNEGQKTIIYSGSGDGKSTLASLNPRSIFIGLDDGARLLRRPDGSPVRFIPGVETYQDVRDALVQPGLFNAGDMLVIDTITRLEQLAEAHLIATVKDERGNAVTSI